MALRKAIREGSRLTSGSRSLEEAKASCLWPLAHQSPGPLEGKGRMAAPPSRPARVLASPGSPAEIGAEGLGGRALHRLSGGRLRAVASL